MNLEFALICAPYNAKKSCYSLNMTLDGPNITVQVSAGHHVLIIIGVFNASTRTRMSMSFGGLSRCTISRRLGWAFRHAIFMKFRLGQASDYVFV